MKIKWSLDINTGAVERSEAARARRLAGATGGNNTLRAGAPREILPWMRPCPVTPGLSVVGKSSVGRHSSGVALKSRNSLRISSR